MNLPAPVSFEPAPADLYRFWFCADGAEIASAAELGPRWFGGGDELDRYLRDHYTLVLEQAMSGGLNDWKAEPRGRLALIVLLDQFSRNIFRGTARAFAGDSRARALATTGWASGKFFKYHWAEQVMALMPFEHSETLSDQDRSVAGFEGLYAEFKDDAGEALKGFVEHAHQHRDIVQQFGRFPHRNAVLGRESTEAEVDFLKSGPRFGQ